MAGVEVREYSNPACGYREAVEAEDGSWIVYVEADGTPKLYVRNEQGDYVFARQVPRPRPSELHLGVLSNPIARR